jgi:hypothetical protein
MDIKFADSFGDSIKTLIRHQTWWYKTYETIRYKIPVFFKNIYRFRNVLWNHRWWDYRFTLETLQTSLEIMERGMHGGLEVFESRGKKIAKMQRAIQILKNINEDNYIEMAEAELGEIIHHPWEFEETGDTTDNPLGEKNEKLYKLVDYDTDEEREHNRKVYDRTHELEEQEWNELFEILKGQNYKEYYETLSEEEKKNQNNYDNWFDGSGLRGWWD